jgi:hypothetical protein
MTFGFSLQLILNKICKDAKRSAGQISDFRLVFSPEICKDAKRSVGQISDFRLFSLCFLTSHRVFYILLLLHERIVQPVNLKNPVCSPHLGNTAVLPTKFGNSAQLDNTMLSVYVRNLSDYYRICASK